MTSCRIGVRTFPQFGAARGGRHHPVTVVAHRFLLVSARSGAFRFDPLRVERARIDEGSHRSRHVNADPHVAAEPILIYGVDFRSESGSLAGMSDSPTARRSRAPDEAVDCRNRWIDERCGRLPDPSPEGPNADLCELHDHRSHLPRRFARSKDKPRPKIEVRSVREYTPPSPGTQGPRST